jgi:hypothetical protein
MFRVLSILIWKITHLFVKDHQLRIYRKGHNFWAGFYICWIFLAESLLQKKKIPHKQLFLDMFTNTWLS